MLVCNPGRGMTDFEQQAIDQGYKFVIGVDEAGRGPLAGPVVAAAVALRKRSFPFPIKDSKKMSARQRERAFDAICRQAYIGIGIMNENVVDRENILRATFLAMDNAVLQLTRHLPTEETTQAQFVRRICLLVDGDRFKSDLPYSVRTIVKGDAKVLSIACASIIAKVTRDRILGVYHRVFPEYGFNRHKGYPTKEHKQAIRDFGVSIIHRKTFCYH